MTMQWYSKAQVDALLETVNDAIDAAAASGGGSPSPEDIEAAVNNFLTANPPSAVVVTDLDNGYLSI